MSKTLGIILEKSLSLLERLFVQQTPPATYGPPPQTRRDRLRDALLMCSKLTEAEVDEYICFEYDGIEDVPVPLDYELADGEYETGRFHADGLLLSRRVKRHTNQISEDTLKKVLQVLPGICLWSDSGHCTSEQLEKCLHCAHIHRGTFSSGTFSHH